MSSPPSPTHKSQPAINTFSRPISQQTIVNPDPAPTQRLLHAANNARFALSVVVLLSSIVVISTTANTLSVYNSSHLASTFHLPLWPNALNLRPSIALIVCGSVIFLSSAAEIAVLRIPTLANKTSPILTLLFPLISLAAAIISTAFFYADDASSTSWTLQAWTCQWRDVAMSVTPNWGRLCSESETAVDLMLVLLVLEVLVLGLAAAGVVAGKTGGEREERKGSPVNV